MRPLEGRDVELLHLEKRLRYTGDLVPGPMRHHVAHRSWDDLPEESALACLSRGMKDVKRVKDVKKGRDTADLVTR
jgi:hypothetical protein